VLVNDDTANGFYAVWNPERVGAATWSSFEAVDAVIKFQVLAGAMRGLRRLAMAIKSVIRWQMLRPNANERMVSSRVMFSDALRVFRGVFVSSRDGLCVKRLFEKLGSWTRSEPLPPERRDSKPWARAPLSKECSLLWFRTHIRRDCDF